MAGRNLGKLDSATPGPSVLTFGIVRQHARLPTFESSPFRSIPNEGLNRTELSLIKISVLPNLTVSPSAANKKLLYLEPHK